MSITQEYILLLKKRKIQERLLEIAIDKIFPWAEGIANEEEPTEFHPRKIKREFDSTVIGICQELCEVK